MEKLHLLCECIDTYAYFWVHFFADDIMKYKPIIQLLAAARIQAYLLDRQVRQK